MTRILPTLVALHLSFIFFSSVCLLQPSEAIVMASILLSVASLLTIPPIIGVIYGAGHRRVLAVWALFSCILISMVSWACIESSPALVAYSIVDIFLSTIGFFWAFALTPLLACWYDRDRVCVVVVICGLVVLLVASFFPSPGVPYVLCASTYAFFWLLFLYASSRCGGFEGRETTQQ
mgnify:CR=1 FL=1